MDVPLDTHMMGECTSRRHFGGSETVPSRALDWFAGAPDEGGTCPTCDSKLHHLSVYVQKEKFRKQSQAGRLLPKGDEEGMTIHSPNNTHSFWLAAF